MKLLFKRVFKEEGKELSGFIHSGSSIKPSMESLRISIIYGLIGALWILMSDKLVERTAVDPKIYSNIQTFKGWFYVMATTIMVYILIKNRMILFQNAIEQVYQGYEEIMITEQELRRQFDEVEKHRRALNDSDEKYKLVVEGSNDGIWEWDIKEEKFYFSLKLKSIFGYQDGELDDNFDAWKELLHPEDRQLTLDEIEGYISTGEDIYKSTYRLRCKDGSYRWILSRGKAIRDENGHAVKLAGSHTDITEQVNLQAHLHRERVLAENMIENVSMVVIIWDREGRIKKLSPFAQKLLGYKDEEVYGKKWFEILIPKDNIHNLHRVFDIIGREERMKNYELPLISKDGQIIDILWNSSLIHSENGDIVEIVSIGADITDLKLMEKKLHTLAYYDGLTGLPNREFLDLELKNILEISSKENKKFALIYFDIDNFKHINDTLGHSTGDRLLKYLANVLKYQVKAPDLVARLSGDEFVIVLNNILNQEDVIKRIGLIFKYLKRTWTLERQEFFVSYSIGIALYPDHGQDLDTLLKNADTAMFNAKERGKDGYRFYEMEMHQKTLNFINMANQLRHAIKSEEFTLYYQPQIDLKSGRIVGLEALIRWIHPKQGVISPLTFIPFAEETGYIHEIGEWVLKTALLQKKRWDDQGYPPIKISINISGKSLISGNLVQGVKKIVDSTNVNYSDIELEITETSIMADLQTAVGVLTELRGLGVQIAMDDFGTGYSSLTYLKKLPIDIVKMDRGFINNFSDKDEAIIKTVIQLAHALGIKVVAEGIETKEQLDFLRINGSDFGQGYLFSKPVPAKEIEEMLQHRWKCNFGIE